MQNTEPVLESRDDESVLPSKLLLLLRADGLIWSVLNQRNEITGHRMVAYTANLGTPFIEWCKNTLKQEEAIQRSFQKVVAGLALSPSTLFPQKLFSDSHSRSAGHFMFTLTDQHTLLHDPWNEQQCVLLHPEYTALTDCLSSFFTNAVFFHANSGLLRSALRHSSPNSGVRVYLFVQGQRMLIMAMENKQLIQYIDQTFSHEDDIAYFLLLLYQQMEFNPELVPVYILSGIEKDSKVYHAVYRFVRHVHFVPQPDWVSLHSNSPVIRIGHYADLYSLLLCE